MAVADLNGDGQFDVVAASDSTPGILVMISNGPQGFLAPVTFNIGAAPAAIAVGDFNNDQKVDLVTSNFSSGNISILLGNGAGSFAAPMNIAVGNTSLPGVAVGDFNGDHNQDLAVANSNGTTAILLGTGAGTFTGPTFFPFAGRISSNGIADFNIDGNNDLVIAGSQIAIVFGNGSGGFGTPAPIASGAGEPFAVATRDFNNDGKPDLAITRYSSVEVFINSGAGTFGAPTTFAVAGSNTTAIVSADFNNDGQYDLAVGHNTGIAVRFGTGTGTFGNAVNLPIGLGPTELAAGDLNGDGATDLALSFYSAGTVAFLLNDGNGNLKIAPTYSSNTDANSVVARDFNNDGKVDLAVANRNGNSVSIHLGNGAGAFGAARVFTIGERPTFNITNGPLSMAAADFNGDNNVDLVTANFTGGSVSVLLGDGAGNLAATKISVAGSGQPRWVATGDFNLDSKPDIALTSIGNFFNVTVLFGNGNGGFSRTDFPSGVNSSAVAVGDLNADGKPDLFVGSSSGAAFSILLNNGSGGFGAPTVHTRNDNTGQDSVAAFGDFTGDGKIDLVVTNYMRDTVALFPGNGAGALSAPTFVNVGRFPLGLATGDFNADGLLDVATAYENSGAISVLLNNGANGFLAPKDFLGAGPRSSVAAGDFNSDALPDLATESLSVFLNSCASVIAPPPPTLTISNVSVAESAGNALFDVSLSSSSSQTVTVQYQTIGHSAVTGADFQVTAGTLTFVPGETAKQISVPILDDALNEFSETFFVNLHKPINAAIRKPQGTGSIVDADPAPTVGLTGVSVAEGDSGTTSANFGVVLSSPSGKLIQLTYSTGDGTAVAGSDYLATSNVVVNIGAGSGSASISVLVNGDTAIEPDETFSLTVSQPVNATITGNSATGTIANDDFIGLLLDSSGPAVNQAAALDSVLLVRDPFPVLSIAAWWNLGSDGNTRVLVFANKLTLNAGETAADVTIRLVDSTSQTHNVAAEDVRAVPNSSFTQVRFRLPNGLPAGNCLITIHAQGQTSNTGAFRIAPQ